MFFRICKFLGRRSTLNSLRMTSSVENSLLMPPIAVRGMTEFDAARFSKDVSVPYIKIPSRIVGRLVGAKALQEFVLRRNARLKSIMNGESSDEKLMLFDPDVVLKKEDAFQIIHDTVKQITDLDISVEYKNFTLNYEDWDIKRCFKAVLPEGLEFSAHTQAGHILHVNLREDLAPYKFVIARILLDKVNHARTVVNKLDQINSEFRFFELELLAGEEDYITQVSENGFKYKIDFSKVFWNSRLNTEHNRVIDEIRLQKEKAILFDVFAGVGPFVIPVIFLKNTVKAYANDLNPTSVEYLKENLKTNKAPDEKVAVYNLDGAEFIQTALPIAYQEYCNSSLNEPVVFHVLMNLPALAVKFLPAFKSALSNVSTIRSDDKKCDFIVHCYMFVKATEDQPDSWFLETATNMVKEQIQSDGIEILKITYVRNVANRKNMYCVKFRLPFDYLTEKESAEDDYFVAEKKQKIEIEA